ncbi:hypothetical protein ABIE50_001175 [Chitinophaga sp. OAE865]
MEIGTFIFNTKICYVNYKPAGKQVCALIEFIAKELIKSFQAFQRFARYIQVI